MEEGLQLMRRGAGIGGPGLAATLLLTGSLLAAGAENGVFWAVGNDRSEPHAVRVYKVDLATGRTLAGPALDAVTAYGQLSGDGRLYLLPQPDPADRARAGTVWCLRAASLTKEWTFAPASRPVEMDQILLDPKSGRLLLSCSYTRPPFATWIVDPKRPALIATLDARGRLLLDAANHLVYANAGATLWTIDPAAMKLVSEQKIPGMELLALPRRPELLVIAAHRLFRLWDPRSNAVRRESRRFPLLRGYAATADGSRVFALTSRADEPAQAVIFDLNSFAASRTLKLPGRGSHFTPAPDGRGMWYAEQGGAVHRLDDVIGTVIESIPLTFDFHQMVLPAGASLPPVPF